MDALIERGASCVAVLDIASAALERSRVRLGTRGTTVQWLAHDVTDTTRPLPTVDIWHDRAVFHFLTDESDRKQYVRQVRHSLKVGGALIMATFALDGPERCSGLPVARYSPETLATTLGPDFRLIARAREEHRTPGGGGQAFQWSLLRHLGSDR